MTIRQDWDPQPPDDVAPCEATTRRQEPASGLVLGPWWTYGCVRAAGDHDNHYHPDIGWWEDETDERPF